jgi:hypothetical protein
MMARRRRTTSFAVANANPDHPAGDAALGCWRRDRVRDVRRSLEPQTPDLAGDAKVGDVRVMIDLNTCMLQYQVLVQVVSSRFSSLLYFMELDTALLGPMV